MITASGLSVFFGPTNLITTISGEHDGRLYGGDGGDYIYKSGAVYKIDSSEVRMIKDGYFGGITNIYDSNYRTIVGTSSYPVQKLYSQLALNETTAGWSLSTASPSGVCNYILSDDGAGIVEIPVLTGNYSEIGNRIDMIINLTSSQDSDTGIPQTTEIALITDLEAAI